MPEARRLLSSAILLGSAALLLAGCAADGVASGDTATIAEVACAPSGAASEAVSVSTEPLVEPGVVFDFPLSAASTEVSVITEGEGRTAESGSSVTIRYAVYNATSAERVYSSGFTEADAGQTIPVTPGSLIDGLTNSLGCATEGDRLVVVIPPVDAWGETGNTDLGIAGTDSLVFVMDVVAVSEPALARADGVDQEPIAGLPTVELAADGTPTLTIPDAHPPAELEIGVLKLGSGEAVPEDATVTVHYTGVNWRTGETFDSSWGSAAATFSLSGVVEGFAQGIAGQTVGSQLVVVIPPDLGYGPQGGNLTAGIEADDTIVFVIDILGFTA